jgi:hypothetical protein
MTRAKVKIEAVNGHVRDALEKPASGPYLSIRGTTKMLHE